MVIRLSIYTREPPWVAMKKERYSQKATWSCCDTSVNLRQRRLRLTGMGGCIQVSQYLLNLFDNRLIEFDDMQACWEQARTQDFLTGGTNYRPISNLPFLSKLLERIIKDQLETHLDAANLLPECQSAYRKSHSTETALLKVTSDMIMAADAGMVSILWFLDLSAAFDCVDHPILLQRLAVSFGIDSIALAWISSYFANRKCRVRYNGVLSQLSEVDCGVPQGSVLGPVFFTLYSSGVFSLVDHHNFKIHGYADDLQIYQYCLPRDMNTLALRLTRCVEDIEIWMSSNRLRLNVSKTEFLWLGSPRRLDSNTGSIQITNSVIAPSKTVRCLGVVVDPAMTFQEHVASLARACYYHLRQLRSVRRSLSVDSCHALVRALILSRIDYCNGLLGGRIKRALGSARPGHASICSARLSKVEVRSGNCRH